MQSRAERVREQGEEVVEMSHPASAPAHGRSTLRAIDSEFDLRAPGSESVPVSDTKKEQSQARRSQANLRRFLCAADAVALTFSFALAQLIAGPGSASRLGLSAESTVFLLTLPVWFAVAGLYGLYSRDSEHPDHSTADDLVHIFHMVTLGSWAFFIGSWLTRLADPYLPKLVLFWSAAIALLTLGRALARTLWRRKFSSPESTLIIGAGDVGQLIAEKFVEQLGCGVEVVGFVDDFPRELRPTLSHLDVVGSPADLPGLVRRLDVRRIVIAFSNEPDLAIIDVLRSLRGLDVQIDVVPRMYELVGPNATMHMLGGLPLVGLPPLSLSRTELTLKRVFDVVASAIGLLILAPLFAFIALRIKLDSPGPVFYRHERVGKGGHKFGCFKFRTMHTRFCRGDNEEAEEEFLRLMSNPDLRKEFEATQKLAKDPRITGFGRFLRHSSLDELPQLINVFLGHISLVGPRPVTEAELARYGSEAVTLRDLPPGATGYWQINGRNKLTYEERVRLDLAYVNSFSLRLDFIILAKTFRVLLSRTGAY